MTGFETVDLAGYPLLQTAQWGQAFDPKVEWLVDRGDRTPDGQHARYHAEYNYCQIFRSEDLESVLTRVECALEGSLMPLRLGSPESPSYAMAGVRYYSLSGERMRHTIRVLRPLVRRSIDYDRYGIPLDKPRSEYLCELSVQVNPWTTT